MHRKKQRPPKTEPIWGTITIFDPYIGIPESVNLS